MEVFRKSLSTVFTGERRYVIPLFQRPYVWSREQQWEPLWEDIAACAEAERAMSHEDGPVHFLGAIVVQQRRSWGDELLSHDVIDGQQRLTTFQILLTALRDIAAGLVDKRDHAWLEGLTRNPNAIHEPHVEQFKVWPTGRDVEQYILVGSAGSKEALQTVHPPVMKRGRLLSRPRMVEAYLFFHEALMEWLSAEGEASIGDRMRILRRVIDRRLQLVSIELAGNEDPQVIFETLNARGVPLLASDLLRNHIFQRAGQEATKLHEQYWEYFEEPADESIPEGARFWEVEERQGRLYRARLDLFVHHYLSMKLGRDFPAARLFPEYKNWIETQDPFHGSVGKELEDLVRYAKVFHTLISPESTHPLAPRAQRLRILDTSTVYPLVLHLAVEAEVGEDERDGVLMDLESFLVRRMICGRSAKNYNRLFLQLLRDFQDHAKPTRTTFQDLLLMGTGETVDWPTDDDFRSAWVSLDAYTVLKSQRVAMMLRALEEAQHSALSEAINLPGGLSVEHVLPQKWQKNWPLPSGVDKEEATRRREEMVHDFGNLTLLTQPLNTMVSNGEQANKLSAIAQHALLRLNAYFQNRVTWSEDDILERSQRLFQVALRVWPRPKGN